MPRYTTYSTGTVTATNGSRTVTGINTAWMVASTQEFQVVGGDLLRIGNQRPVVIDTVDSPTQITLVEAWPHSAATNSAYTIIRYATPPEARVLGALETLAQRGSSTSPFERITFDSGGVRFQLRDDGSGLVGLYIGATGTADGSLTLAETINRMTLARLLRGPLSWTGTTYMGLLIQSLTTTQRDALSSPGNGGIIYNSTLDRHQFRAGGAWHEHVRRGGDTITGVLTINPGTGTVATDASSLVTQTTAAVGGIANDQRRVYRWSSAVGVNTSNFDMIQLRTNTGGDWGGSRLRLIRAIDALPQCWIDFGGDDTFYSSGMAFATGNTANRVLITSAGLVSIGAGVAPSTSLHVGGPIRHLTYTVATLPAAGTVGAGTRAAVTDANATTFNAIVAAGGANFVPVISDGTNWRIG